MNSDSVPRRSVTAYVIAILGAFLIVAALVWMMQRYIQPAPLGEDRVAVRTKALAEIRAAEADALNNPGWMDQAKGIVRLPITNAVQMVLEKWQNPAAARSNLIERVEKATAAPPKAPEKPSAFE